MKFLMKAIPYLLVLFISGSLISCEEENLSPSFSHQYFVTFGANPWGDAVDDEDELKDDVVNYLKAKDINVKDIDIGLILIHVFCNTDECLTSQVVWIRISNKDSIKLNELEEGWRDF